MSVKPSLLMYRFGFAVPALMLMLGAAIGDDRVDFDRDIRRILSDNCFQCHGPAEENRAAELRLDRKASAFANADGEARIVPGMPSESELFRRVTAEDPDVRMPPHDSGRSLTAEQVELIGQWIRQGAEWKEHWSFAPPSAPAEPEVQDRSWIRTPIDAFVLSRLEQEGLQHAPEAERTTLIRRVTLDLTGLPPTPEDVDAFLLDTTSDAWENVIDRLLDSSAYGERMAVRWLDLARYADTSGYQNDGPRDMWRWRDWVINAYNSNMPFDQFTIEQLAGDMLQDTPAPGRTGLGGLELGDAALDRWIASGFNRNHRGNSEGGVDPDEYQVEYVVDRVDTTATVWLGLSMGCARCHDHKYDPITQSEFYQLFACFNNIPENGRALKDGNSPPYIKAPTLPQRTRLEKLNKELAALRQQWNQKQSALNEAQSVWEQSLVSDESSKEPAAGTLTEGLTVRLTLDHDVANSASVAEPAESTAPATATAVTANPAEHLFGPGPLGNALLLNGKDPVEAGDIGTLDFMETFTLAAWVKPESDGTILSRKAPEAEGQGYSIGISDGHVSVNLINRWLDDCIRLASVQSLKFGEWQHVAVTYDGTRQAAGVVVYINGAACDNDVHFDFLNQTIASEEPFRIGSGVTPLRGAVDEVRIYDRCLAATDVSIMAAATSLTDIARMPAEQRSVPARRKLQHSFIKLAAPKEYGELSAQIRQKEGERDQLVIEIPTAMVMHESAPRTTRILKRGQFDQPTTAVQPAVPEILTTGPTELQDGRVGLARWLVSGKHPLTARVAVNRYWEMFFGEGLVRSMEDFGSQGSRPSHPQLLDWLATEFVRSGWNVKQIHKTIAMSATYRQTSTTSAELRERDPKNELLARASRFRLSAEVVRDQALAASGLLFNKTGGPSVKTYQPAGLWKEIASTKEYELAKGHDLYRRSLYTYWKRTVGPPSMLTFDATTREMCTVRRARTNTPLQALALMNDVTYVEASRALAQRMIREGGTTDRNRVERGFRLVLARQPGLEESQILCESAARYQQQFEKSDDAAEQLLAIGESPVADGIPSRELATWTAVASVILNLDETVTRR
ncbi:MAG: DUF1553 domain-containing protein [Planctomycetaceae bacterium]